MMQEGHGTAVTVVTSLGLPRETLALLWYYDYLSYAWRATYSKPL
jgi:hypothetical protein